MLDDERGLVVNAVPRMFTTCPCHNCTRHIIAAGLSSVTYIEPYPKSRAADPHEDAAAGIFIPTSQRNSKVIPME